MPKTWLPVLVLLGGLAWAAPPKYVLMIDVSPSMIGREDSQVLVWPFVQRQLLRFADELPAGTVQVFPFAGEVLPSKGFSFPAEREAFKRYVRSLPISGNGSAIVSSVAHIYAQTCTAGAALYLFTDGLDNPSEGVQLPRGGSCTFAAVTAGRGLPADFLRQLSAASVAVLASPTVIAPAASLAAEAKPSGQQPLEGVKPTPKARATFNVSPKPVASSSVSPGTALAPKQPSAQPKKASASLSPAKSVPNPVIVKAAPPQQAPALARQKPKPSARPQAAEVGPQPKPAKPQAASGRSQSSRSVSLPQPFVSFAPAAPVQLTPAQASLPAQAAPRNAYSLWPWLVFAVALFLTVLARRPRPASWQKVAPTVALPPASFSETLALSPETQSQGRIELLLPQEMPMLVYPSEAATVNLGQYLRLPGLSGLTVRLTPEGMLLCEMPEGSTARLRTRSLKAGDLVSYGEVMALETGQGQSLGWIRPANRRLSLRS